MHEVKGIPVADLLLDQDNARLPDPQTSQAATHLALAKVVKGQLIELAKDIVEYGLDPTAPSAVIPTGGDRFTVLEGNRRLLALKALDTPSIVKGGLSNADHKKLEALARTYAQSPIDDVPCVIFDSEDEAEHWIVLRHTAGHGGASLVAWDANQADRYKARKGKARDIAGQAIDFVDQIDGAGESRGIISTLRRILNNKTARDHLGLVRDGDQLSSVYPAEETIKGLRKVVDDLRSKEIRTKHVYDAEAISDYIATFKRTELPAKSKRLPAAVKLGELTTSQGTPPKKAKPRPKPNRPRNTLIPRTCAINATGRLNNIYNELLKIDVDSYPNACSVMLRVFVELAVDAEIAKRPHLKGKADQSATLAKRLKELAGDMEGSGQIDNDLKRAVSRIADNARGNLALGTTTMNQFVHNRYVHPQPSELRTAWDELQPFMEAVLK